MKNKMTRKESNTNNKHRHISEGNVLFHKKSIVSYHSSTNKVPIEHRASMVETLKLKALDKEESVSKQLNKRITIDTDVNKNYFSEYKGKEKKVYHITDHSTNKGLTIITAKEKTTRNKGQITPSLSWIKRNSTTGSTSRLYSTSFCQGSESTRTKSTHIKYLTTAMTSTLQNESPRKSLKDESELECNTLLKIINKTKSLLSIALNKFDSVNGLDLICFEIESLTFESEYVNHNIKIKNEKESKSDLTADIKASYIQDNIEHITMSSEKRISMYVNYFNTCKDCIVQIKDLILTKEDSNSSRMNNVYSITNTTYNNMITSPNSSNVNLNLNVNLQTINRNIRKNARQPTIRYPNKKISKKRISLDYDISLTEDNFTCDLNEGSAANIPNCKQIHVNKPQEGNMKFRMHSEGDAESKEDVLIKPIGGFYTESDEEINLKHKKKIKHNTKKNVFNINLFQKATNPIRIIKPDMVVSENAQGDDYNLEIEENFLPDEKIFSFNINDITELRQTPTKKTVNNKLNNDHTVKITVDALNKNLQTQKLTKEFRLIEDYTQSDTRKEKCIIF